MDYFVNNRIKQSKSPLLRVNVDKPVCLVSKPGGFLPAEFLKPYSYFFLYCHNPKTPMGDCGITPAALTQGVLAKPGQSRSILNRVFINVFFASHLYRKLVYLACRFYAVLLPQPFVDFFYYRYPFRNRQIVEKADYRYLNVLLLFSH